MDYFDTEITIPVRVYYDYQIGCDPTHHGPSEPDEIEITYVELKETKDNENYILHDLSAEVLDVCEEDLEEQAFGAAEDAQRDAGIDAAECKYDELKENGKI